MLGPSLYASRTIESPPPPLGELVTSLVKTYEPGHEISNNVVYATSKDSDQPAHTRSLIRAFASRLNIT